MDYEPQSELEKLNELFKSGFITEWEYNKRRKELGDNSATDNSTNQYNNSFGSNNYNDHSSISTHDYNQVIPVTYDDYNNTSTYNNNDYNNNYNNNYTSTYNNNDYNNNYTSTYNNNDYNNNYNNDYTSTHNNENYNSTSTYDFNQVIPVTYDNDTTNNTPTSNDYNSTNSSTYDYNQTTPVTYDINQYSSYTDKNDQYNTYNNNENNKSENINYNNKQNKETEEFDDTYVINIKPPIVKKSYVVESRNVNKEKANRKVEYPLIVNQSNTIHKDIGNNFVLYTKDKQGNHQSDLIPLEGKTQADILKCMQQFIGIRESVFCDFIIFKLIVDSKRPEPERWGSMNNLSNYENYRVQVFPGDKELLEPNHFLLEYASYPIHRSGWNPSTHYRHPHLFSQITESFKGFPTSKDSYDYSTYKNTVPMKACVSSQFKTKYSKINFLLSYRYFQNLSTTNLFQSTLKKESILNITDKIKQSINNGTCAFCNESIYSNQSFLCSNHYNKNLINAYESFTYLNNNGLLDETIEEVDEVLSNQQIKYEEEVKDIVINKEKFKLLEPEQLIEITKDKYSGLSNFLLDKFANLHNENYDENQIENNFKIDYSRQNSQDDYYDYYF